MGGSLLCAIACAGGCASQTTVPPAEWTLSFAPQADLAAAETSDNTLVVAVAAPTQAQVARVDAATGTLQATVTATEGSVGGDAYIAIRTDDQRDAIVAWLTSTGTTIAAYDANLARQWTASVDGNGEEMDFDVGADGSVAVAIMIAGSNDIAVTSFARDGSTRWTVVVPNGYLPTSVNFADTGDVFVFDGGSSRVRLEAATGAVLETVRLPLVVEGWGFGEHDGGFLMINYDDHMKPGIAAYDPSGQELWMRMFDFSSFDAAVAIGSQSILAVATTNFTEYQMLALDAATGSTLGIVDGDATLLPLTADTERYFTNTAGVLTAHAMP